MASDVMANALGMEFSPASSTLEEPKLYHAARAQRNRSASGFGLGSAMPGRALSGGELVARLGPHPARLWGLDLGTDAGLGRWLVTACLLAPRGDEAAAGAARSLLAERGLDAPDGLARSGPGPVAAALKAAAYPKPEIMAARLVRASASLISRHRGSLSALAASADGIEELGSALLALAPGVGAATAGEFLRPLRERFTAARELPLAAPARIAALHLGWLTESEDQEGEPGALRAVLARELPVPDLADVESALARLGRSACRRGATQRCPLGADCPLRAAQP
jgi:endonuclease III